MLFFASTYSDPTIITYVGLVLALGLALAFEFVNGFHDTANAVATVIYTNTLKPTPAVVWSGICNLIGVLSSSGLVAFAIVALLPAELVVNIGSGAGFAMVFSLLISAILWNLSTWYFALPASSSHTLVGAIIGVGLANSYLEPNVTITSGVDWAEAEKVGLGLLISPLLGFFCAAALLLLCKALIKNPALYEAPKNKEKPPLWIRGILLTTCTGVSFAHGSNDGQKGMGLIVLILVGILPGTYALKMTADHTTISQVATSANELGMNFAKSSNEIILDDEESETVLTHYIKRNQAVTPEVYAALTYMCNDLFQRLEKLDTLQEVPEDERGAVRTDLFVIATSINKLNKDGVLTDPSTAALAAGLKKSSEDLTNYIPDWVKYAVALALGLGTMVGYKRIVVTVGERIGRTHMTYAQGASAEFVAMSTILVADHFGLPVSTTHVLSSGVAGTMAANKSGLQMVTLRNILLAWILTLPVCIFMGALLFAFGLNVAALL